MIQILEGITEQCETYGISSIRFDHVKSWADMIMESRKQCKKCIQAEVLIELFNLASLFFSLLFFIFAVQEIIALNLFYESNVSVMVAYSLQSVLKLLMKIHFAGKVTESVCM